MNQLALPGIDNQMHAKDAPSPRLTTAAAYQRRRRIEAGERQKKEEAEAWPGLQPARSELMIPLLKTIADAGAQKPADVAEAVADMLGIPDEVRGATAAYNGKRSNLWHRTVRWAMQDGRRNGWMFAEERGRWAITQAGNEALGRVRTGVRLVVFQTNLGEAVATIAQEAAAIVEEGSVQALFTSPLFPLTSNMKSYGSMEPAQWLPWMMEMLASWLPLMREDGIMAIHMGATHYRGMPAISNYRERFILATQDDLGLYRLPDLFWENTSRLPTLEWGAKRGMTPRGTVDPIYLLSKSPFPYLNAGDMRQERKTPGKDIGRQAEVRPSGLKFGPGSFTSTKTAFPSALVTAGGASGAETWRKRLKERGMTAHPCPMPIPVPKFVIQMTTKPGDLVFDPFFGSGTTGAAAEQLGRRWIGLDHHRIFLEAAGLRPEFTSAEGYHSLAA